MMNATDDALHAIVADTFRCFPGTQQAMSCPACVSSHSVIRASVTGQGSLMAYRCRCCGCEWLDKDSTEDSC
jgi:transposase-like protein